VTASFAPVPIDDDDVCFLSRSATLSVSPKYIMSVDIQVFGSGSDDATMTARWVRESLAVWGCEQIPGPQQGGDISTFKPNNLGKSSLLG